jgi:hypothetical protein
MRVLKSLLETSDTDSVHFPFGLPMSPALFCVFFLFSAGGLTLWIDTRFPALAPKELGRVMIHMGAVAGIAAFAVPIGMSGTLQRGQPIAAVFCVALPVLVYLLTTSLWLMKVLQGMMESRFH